MSDDQDLIPRRRLPLKIPYLSWRDLAVGVWPLIILTIIAFIVALRFVSPAPPHTLTFRYLAAKLRRSDSANFSSICTKNSSPS